MVDNLSKEYLKEFGWEHIAGFFYHYPIKNKIIIDEYSNRTLDFKLNFVDYGRYLLLEAYERNSFKWEVCYRGRCNNEEDFEWIMKQFNILRIEHKINKQKMKEKYYLVYDPSDDEPIYISKNLEKVKLDTEESGSSYREISYYE